MSSEVRSKLRLDDGRDSKYRSCNESKTAIA